MQIITLTYPHSLLKEELPETAAAIGFFDGIHRGHQEVINTAITQARKNDIESAVVTFHPHPSTVFKNYGQHVQYITPLPEKQSVLQQLGLDRIYVITFDNDLASLAPQTFIDQFINQLNIQYLVAGFDFSYGPKDEANANTLEGHSRNAFDVTIIEPVKWEGDIVSSTRIRELLHSGDIEKVNKLLDRPFSTRGIVREGDKRGRTIGFPTANLEISRDALLPRTGIYAVTVWYQQECYEGMASIGYNPTFITDREEPVVEVNIFDNDLDLYGEELVLEWHHFVRGEIEFDTPEELIKQMENDETHIRQFFQQIR